MKVVAQCPYCQAGIHIKLENRFDYSEVIYCDGENDEYCGAKFAIEVNWQPEVTEYGFVNKKSSEK